MVQGCIVLWEYPSHFNNVHDKIFSDDPADVRWAIDEISVWESRSSPSLPTAIEATVIIKRAVMMDMLCREGSMPSQEQDVQAMYICAIVRFVNLTLEAERFSEGKPRMAFLAKRIGLPLWLLDVRHQSTHATAPSLPICRAAADAALKFLDNHFWKLERQRLKSCIRNDIKNENKVCELICSYKELMFNNLKGDTNLEEIAHIKLELSSLIKKPMRKRFLELLSIPGMFIFTDQEFKKLSKHGCRKYLTNPEETDLPTIVEHFWEHIMIILVKYDLLGDFLEELLLTQHRRDSMGQKLIMSWVLRILKTAVYKTPSILLNCYEAHGVFFNWNRLLYACTRNPGKYTSILFAAFVPFVEMNDVQKNGIMTVITIALGETLPSDKELKAFYKNSPNIFTVKQLEQRKKIESEIENEESTSENKWHCASDEINFAELPIGEIINPTHKIEPEEQMCEDIEDDLGKSVEAAIIDDSDRIDQNEVMDENFSERSDEELGTLNEEAVVDEQDIHIDFTNHTVFDDMVYKKR